MRAEIHPPGYERVEATAKTDVITEDSAACEFAELYRDRLRFDHDAGTWLQWAGHHWRTENTGLAFEWARELSRRLAEGANPKGRYAIAKTSFAAGVEKFARSDRAFAVTAGYWNADKFLLGTPRGTVDLRTGELRDANPADGVSKIAAAAPATTDDCPLWKRFLLEATANDPDLVRFLQQIAGYSLTGDIREQCLAFVYGPGGNGKTVFANVLREILGDYALAAPMDAFTIATGERHSTELAMLAGARFVVASETEKGRRWAEARIKSLTGGDPITARFMRQDNFTFTPQFKLLFIGNHKPVLRNVDEAIRRRFNIIPFLHSPARPDRLLEAKLRPEWPGILRWAIDGCLDWQKSGLVRPRVVLQATGEYFVQQDLFGEWLEETCIIEPDNRYLISRSADLYGSWKTYATTAGEQPGSRITFAESLTALGLERDRGTDGSRAYRGIALKRPPEAGDGI